MWGIIGSILIGALCGWLASIIMKSKGGLLFYIITGILGGLIGSLLSHFIRIGGGGTLGDIIMGVIGTCLLILGYRFLFEKKR